MREGTLPLRTVLQNFINHVDSLEDANPINEDLYENEFQELKKFTEDLKGNGECSSTEGEKDCNRRKNRYKDILPYDYSRVVLQDIPGIPGSDYVNANFIRGASGSRTYIASQGPLPHTVSEFWRMVVEWDVQVIIMASNETEGGKHKCECYWGNTLGEEKQFGNVQVTYIKSREVCPDFLVRTLKIKYSSENNTNEERIICQFHYILWPDHGIPDAVRPLLEMVRIVRDCQSSESLPVLVHCSAGCGRTGTICAIDYVWGLLRSGQLYQNLNLFELVKDMRKQRVAMVQTREQYVLLHQAVKELFSERLRLIDTHPYENVTTDGNPIIPTEKESDYEELIVSSEKQDKSTKTTESNSSIGDSQVTRNARDSIRKSVSTTSLDSCSIPKTKHSPEKTNILNPIISTSEGVHQSTTKEGKYMNGNPFKTQTHCTALQNASDCAVSVIERKNYPKPSKMEKDAENFAQLTKEKVMLGKQPRSISNLTRKFIQGQQVLFAGDLTVENHGNRIPSPNINSQRALTSPGSDIIVGKDPISKAQSKATESSKRPHIQKLKEVFENSLVPGPRPIRLTRSASSVSIRPNFSIANNSRDLEDLKKSSTNVLSNKYKDKHLIICPPPPIDSIPVQWKMKRSLTALSFPSNRQPNDFHPNMQSKCIKPARPDDRPVLPIKKSKSFRSSGHDQSRLTCSKVEIRKPLSHAQPIRANIVNQNINLDAPTIKEKLRLSVYQGSSDVSSSSSSSTTDSHSSAEHKPIIPPKKAIGERYKKINLQPPVTKNPMTSASISNFEIKHSRINQPLIEEKLSKTSVGTQMYPNELTLKKSLPENVVDYDSEEVISSKSPLNSYVNAKLVKSPGDENNYTYVPIPSKRTGRNRNEYVNYRVMGLDKAHTTTVNNKMNQTGSDGKITSDRRLVEDENFILQPSPSFVIKKVNNPTASHYEPIDFGESLNLSNDVFETVNYELVNPKPSPVTDVEQKDYYLNKDLDTIAKQVYKDCEDYLLSRDNRSPVPSLLPKQITVDSHKNIKRSDKTHKETNEINPSALEHVINKIAVAPQGLRNRERRNSYRQAVSSATSSCGKKMESLHSKNVNKYERIWFQSDEKNSSARSRVFQDSASSKKIPTDFSFNINKDMNIDNKESLFKDKLEEMHLMMNDIERKHLQYLPDLSEEDISSKHSSSTSSLVSRSGQSSRSSERAEPVYVNTAGNIKPCMYVSPEEQRFGQLTVSRKNKSEIETHNMGGSSHYGTLATTTSYPYRTSRTPQYGLNSDSVITSNAKPYTSTLPLRSAEIIPDSKSLYTRSIYHKPLVQNGPKANNHHHPPQVNQGSSKTTKSGSASARSLPVLHHKEHGLRKRDHLKRMDQPISSKPNAPKRLHSSFGVQPPSAPPRVKRNSLLDETLETLFHLNCDKPSEVHRKRQQLNAKETFFKPSDLPFLAGHTPLQQSMSTPYFNSLPQKSNRLEANKSPNDVGILSDKADHGKNNIMPKKKHSKDLNCVSSTTLSDSSLEDSSSDEEGVFVKFAPAKILKKLRNSQVNSSKFYGKEDNSDSFDYQSSAEVGVVSPSASPKTFTKAFGKLKIGSKNVAANFKSYIKGEKSTEEDSIAKTEICHNPSVQSFADVKDFKYPLPLPKKPQGIRQIPSNFSSNSASLGKKSKQQYL